MRLHPDDIMQKGDIVHYRNMESYRIVASYAGRPVSIFHDDEIYFVERPDPDPELIKLQKENIHLEANLRDAWEVINKAAHDLGKPPKDGSFGYSPYYDACKSLWDYLAQHPESAKWIEGNQTIKTLIYALTMVRDHYVGLVHSSESNRSILAIINGALEEAK